MKASILSIALSAAAVNAHTIFWELGVNGEAQGSLVGVRAPSSNQYVSDVTSSSIACNTGLQSPVSTDVIDVSVGDTIATVWGHIIGGAQYSGDTDNPIASSHKGPIQMYMAAVDDASSADGSDLAWFKVASEGLDTSTDTWGVDSLIAGGGWWNFTMPSLTAGQYLLRGEVIALHSAYNAGGAQFYLSCAALNVQGSGTCSPTDTVSFPGAYAADDASIVINIYGSSGEPDNGGAAYTAPGPDVISCDDSTSSSTSSSSSSASVVASSTSAAVVASSSSTAAAVATSATTSAATVATSSSAAVVASSSTSAAVVASSSTVAAVATTSSVAATTSSVATTLATSVAPTTTSSAAATTTATDDDDLSCEAESTTVDAVSAVSTGTASTDSVALYGQCGGSNWTGSTTCATGTCKVQNDFYSQCVESS